MTDRTIELSRRKVLATIGAVGTTGATAGLGTSALFGDSETFDGATATAGNLNLKVDWQEHYYDGLGGEASFESLRLVSGQSEVDEGEVGLPTPEAPLIAIDEEDLDAFMEESTLEQSGPVDGPEPGVIELDDVKPGDFGELTMSYHLSDNPGYVALCAGEVSDEENGLTEPESQMGDEGPDGELGEQVRAAVWYDPNCNNLRDAEEPEVVSEGTLNDVLTDLGALDGETCKLLDPRQSGGTVDPEFGGDCHSPWGGGAGACDETLYLTDSGPNGTILFDVTLEDDPMRANLTELDQLPSPEFDQVDAMAATPDGSIIHFIDKNSGHLGAYDVSADSFTDLGPLSGSNVSGFPDGIVMAAYSPDGTLYMASSETDGLYTVDPSVPEFTKVTTINESLRGTDIVFTVDGTLYLISTVDANGKALYTVDPSDGSVTKQGTGTGEQFTGLGVRAAGTGNIVGSATSDDSIYVIGRDGTLGTRYPMYEGGTRYDYDFGDMTVGELCIDQPSGHCVAFAWWVPREVGSEIQSDRYKFSIGFRAEQCRNNDSPPGS